MERLASGSLKAIDLDCSGCSHRRNFDSLTMTERFMPDDNNPFSAGFGGQAFSPNPSRVGVKWKSPTYASPRPGSSFGCAQGQTRLGPSGLPAAHNLRKGGPPLYSMRKMSSCSLSEEGPADAEYRTSAFPRPGICCTVSSP